jgi:hypothetical protein
MPEAGHARVKEERPPRGERDGLFYECSGPGLLGKGESETWGGELIDSVRGIKVLVL